jgi:predicted esterase
LGFSQGAATISRWCLQTKHKINTFVLWAGKIASDFDFAQYKSKHGNSKNCIVFGTKDQFYAVKTIEEYKTEMQDLDATWISYEGDHSIHSETLLRISTLGH